MKTTQDDFDCFKKHAFAWQQKLNLLNWSLYFEHTKLKEAYAKTAWSTDSMAATLQFTTDWDETRPKNVNEINKLALHEVLHVLMAPLISEAQYRYATQFAIDSAEHSIIRCLENICA